MFRKTPLLIGLCCGAVAVLTCLAFIAVSLFTDLRREWRQALNQTKGIVVFGLCGVAGFVAFRRCSTLKAAMGSGCTAGALAGFLVPLSIYLVAYGFLDQVRQFPFEYHSMQGGGFTNAQEFLGSERGSQTVFETTIGLIPIVTAWATLQRGALGLAGGWLGRWFGRKSTTL